MKTKVLLACSILLLFISPGAGRALQDPDATLPKKTTKSEPAKTTPSKVSTGASTGTSRRTGAAPRQAPTTPPSKTSRKRPDGVQRNKAEAAATLAIRVDPPDSTIFINGQEVTYRDDNERLSLRAGSYTVVARRDGYGEVERVVDLLPGQNETVEITLSPLSGTLNVLTNVTEAEINVGGAGTFYGTVNNLKLPPGRYRVTVTKSGYETIARDVAIEPGGLINLEIAMEAVSKPRPRADTAMSLLTSDEGKYLVVVLTGSTGEITAASGSIEVTLDNSSINGRRVTGLLTGYPCRVDFVPLENVAEYSFKEAPGINNQWRKIAVRVRPGNRSRPVRFLINWQVIQRSPGQ